MTEARILRERQRAFLERLDRAQSDRPPFVTARRLVSIRDLGAMPTSADHMFAASPVELDGDETEGAAYTPVVDTATTLFCDVIGGVPAAGDLLTAYAVGGRWVAERRGGGSGGAGCDTRDCSSYYLPHVDFSVDYRDIVTNIAGTSWASGTIAMPYAGVISGLDVWVSSCVSGADRDFTFEIDCPVGSPASAAGFYLVHWAGGFGCANPHLAGLCVGSCGDPGGSSFRTNFNLNPLKIVLSRPGLGLGCFFLKNNLTSGFTITNPAETAPVCRICIRVKNNLDHPIAGATVTISGGGSGETDGNGLVVLDGGSAGSHTVTVAAAGYTTYSGTMSLACNTGYLITLSP